MVAADERLDLVCVIRALASQHRRYYCRVPGFADSLRKADLHLHLEGSIEPETLLEIDPDADLDEARARYACQGFANFIQSFLWVVKKLREPAHYAIAARRLFERLALQNIEYAEVTLSAGVILWKEQNLPRIFEALARETAASPVRVRWVFDAVRQFGAEPAMRAAEFAAEFRADGVVAFGIGGDETAGPPDWFTGVFDYARRQGLAAVPHAGETAGPESVWGALRLGAVRIGHGVRSIEDSALVRHLRDRGIPLEICITSNVATESSPRLEEHPVRRLYDAGVPIVLCTDDPAMFRTSLAREYEIAEEHFGFSQDELRGIADNSFRYALDAGVGK